MLLFKPLNSTLGKFIRFLDFPEILVLSKYGNDLLIYSKYEVSFKIDFNYLPAYFSSGGILNLQICVLISLKEVNLLGSDLYLGGNSYVLTQTFLSNSSFATKQGEAHRYTSIFLKTVLILSTFIKHLFSIKPWVLKDIL